MNELYDELRQIIIDSLNLEDLSINDIEVDAPLFGDGLGLDSIDALELGMAIKQKYGVAMSSDNEDTKKAFYSVKTLAEFVEKERS